MSEVVVTARHPDGTETDITEGVQALYDLVTSSMDWGSGFWTVEDALPVLEVARACGFPTVEEVERYLGAKAGEERRKAEYAMLQEVRATLPRVTVKERPHEDIANFTMAFHGEVTNDHAHSFEKDGVRCVWPGCTLERTHKERDV